MELPNGGVVRTAFKTSRLLEFCSQKELVTQTGHELADWPIVALKELIDNALDACEEAGTAPAIRIEVHADGKIEVADNGPGLPPATVISALDFSTRTSSREAYVGPARGAQGNALKTILAMPYALDGKAGRVSIEACGEAHDITFRADPVRQEPVIDRATSPSFVKTGTRVTVSWPRSARSILDEAMDQFLQIADDYTWLNPHLSLHWGGQDHQPSSPQWEKWRASDPTPPHWYTAKHLARLVAAYVRDDQDRNRARTVREFIAEFRGLSGSAKQKAVADAAGLSRTLLSSLYAADGIDEHKIATLLAAMRSHTKPVKPEALGVIGEDHLRTRFAEAGAMLETFAYRCKKGITGDVPWVIEAAFAYHPDGEGRRLVTGVNWSPGISNPFRKLDDLGRSLDFLLAEQRVTPDLPAIMFLHLACPRVEYKDRGKSSIAIPYDIGQAIREAVEAVTALWAKQIKHEERHARAEANREARLATRPESITLKDAAYRHMETAYMAASANGTLPAHARQLYYQARPLVQAETGEPLGDDYFTQTLLPDYIEDHGVTWNVVYDDRGHFTEPHSDRSVGLGTLAVDRYLAGMGEPCFDPLSIKLPAVRTSGPRGRFGAVLFIEKEGFMPLFKSVQLAARYDLGIMSTKGVSNTAARKLVDKMCACYDIPLFVLHDFDKAGFSILGTLQRATRRYTFTNAIRVIDLGLRLADVNELGLEPEAAASDKGKPDTKRKNMIKNGATHEEAELLLKKRVELNALASDRLVQWLEQKLTEHGVCKVVPDSQTLSEYYKRVKEAEIARAAARAAIEKARKETGEIDVPDDLHEKVVEFVLENPALPWDAAIDEIARRT